MPLPTLCVPTSPTIFRYSLSLHSIPRLNTCAPSHPYIPYPRCPPNPRLKPFFPLRHLRELRATPLCFPFASKPRVFIEKCALYRTIFRYRRFSAPPSPLRGRGRGEGALPCFC